MNLKDAFAGMKEAQELEHSGAQAPKRPSTEAPKPPGAQEPRHLSTQAPKHLGTQAPKRLPLQGTGKSSHPDFEPVKIYIRKDTRKRAWRKWEDAAGGDFSDLVEMLLEKYAGA
jgi:hypothetical protein